MEISKNYAWRSVLTIALSFLCLSCTQPKKEATSSSIIYTKPTSPQVDRPDVLVTIVFTTNRPEARAFDHMDQMQKEINILNKYFLDDQNQTIFDFKLNRYISYDQFSKMKCDLEHLLNRPAQMNPQLIPGSVKKCFPQRKSKEVFFFIYDAYNTKLKYNDITSRGFRNNGRPFILIDWERLNYKTQAATIHEMGHAFGLDHVCAPGAKKTTPTNIMASYDCGKGSGGLRNIGFTPKQLSTILQNYQRYP